MAKTSDSRRAPARGRSGSSRPSGASSQQAVIIGAGAVVVILLVVFMMKRDGGAAPSTPAPTPATQPKAAPAPMPELPMPDPNSKLKPPKTPPPALTQEMLGELGQLYNKAKELHNAGVTARGASDNDTARSKEGEAKQVLQQWHDKVAPQLLWQEQAQMEDWQQPAEYMALERVYGEYQTLTKKVRMGGG